MTCCVKLPASPFPSVSLVLPQLLLRGYLSSLVTRERLVNPERDLKQVQSAFLPPSASAAVVVDSLRRECEVCITPLPQLEGRIRN